MDWEQLVTFDSVVREGSFSRAAWGLNVSQPTVSGRVQSLEGELGGLLFERGARPLRLTELGEVFLPYARRALAVLQEGRDAARSALDGQRGRLSIGTLESLSGGFLMAAVARFVSTHAGVHFAVYSGYHQRVVEMLHDRKVELGLVAWPCDDPALADLTPVISFREPLVLVTSPTHALAAHPAVTLAQVAEWAHPYLDAVRIPDPVLGQLARHGRVLEVPVPSARQLLLSGVGAAFFTRALVAEELREGRLVEREVQDLPRIFRASALMRRAQGPSLSKAASDFIELLRAEAGDLLWKGSGGAERRGLASVSHSLDGEA